MRRRREIDDRPLLPIPASETPDVATRRANALAEALATMSRRSLLNLLGLPDATQATLAAYVAITLAGTDAGATLLRDPRFAPVRERHGLDPGLEPIRYCGGAKTPEQEHQLYRAALKRRAPRRKANPQ